jgi:replicative superfamily II helicase
MLQALEECKMARYDRSGSLYMTEMGRVASHYRYRHESVVVFNERLKPRMTTTRSSYHGPVY